MAKENKNNSGKSAQQSVESRELEAITAAAFKKKYEEAETYADVIELVKSLTKEDLVKIYVALETTNDWCGLTMREEATLRLMKARLEYL